MKLMEKLQQIYTHPIHADMREMIKYSANKFSSKDAFIIKHKEKKTVTYEKVSYTRFYEEINALGSALLKRGFADKRIAIVGKNSYPWALSYFATTCGIGICVPLDKGLPFDEAESSIVRSKADVIIFDKEHGDMIKQIRENHKSNLSLYICMEPYEDFLTLDQLLLEGKEALADGYVDYYQRPIDPDALAIILFTSGTTSMSKAVMLSHRNIVSNAYWAVATEPIYSTDVNMAFLPYHHTFGSTGQVVMLYAGVTTTYCDGLKYLQKNLVEYHVSIFVCVPLLIESIYKKILVSVEKQGKTKLVSTMRKVSNALLKVGIDMRRVFFKSILEQLGGDIRFIISGASGIDPEALKGFNDFGILTVQGYGLTETAPILTAESAKNMRAGSVGKPMPPVDVKIVDPNEDGIGEVVGRGPSIMAGYYENPEETEKVLKDGWFHTGDLGFIDKDGFLFLRGRKKNVIVLKNGKNVYPEELELLISNLPYVEENMVFGMPKHDDENDFTLSLKLVYRPEFFKERDPEITPEIIKDIIEKDVDKINDELPHYKQLRRIIVTDEPMIKTTTGKVKRFEEIKTFQK